MKDDGPYEPQGQLGVSICNVVIPDVDQFDLKMCSFQVNVESWKQGTELNREKNGNIQMLVLCKSA